MNKIDQLIREIEFIKKDTAYFRQLHEIQNQQNAVFNDINTKHLELITTLDKELTRLFWVFIITKVLVLIIILAMIFKGY